MYKTVLVPLDGSLRAEAILPHVEALAQTGARLVLMRVADPSTADPLSNLAADVETMHEALRKEAREAEHYLERMCQRLGAQNIDVSYEVAYGGTVATIINTAHKVNADLIALASHGRTGLARIFYGSVAAGVLNQADRPLLLIRAES